MISNIVIIVCYIQSACFEYILFFIILLSFGKIRTSSRFVEISLQGSLYKVQDEINLKK